MARPEKEKTWLICQLQCQETAPGDSNTWVHMGPGQTLWSRKAEVQTLTTAAAAPPAARSQGPVVVS